MAVRKEASHSLLSNRLLSFELYKRYIYIIHKYYQCNHSFQNACIKVISYLSVLSSIPYTTRGQNLCCPLHGIPTHWFELNTVTDMMFPTQLLPKYTVHQMEALLRNG
jgi:hypothetical protein